MIDLPFDVTFNYLRKIHGSIDLTNAGSTLPAAWTRSYWLQNPDHR